MLDYVKEYEKFNEKVQQKLYKYICLYMRAEISDAG